MTIIWIYLVVLFKQYNTTQHIFLQRLNNIIRTMLLEQHYQTGPIFYNLSILNLHNSFIWWNACFVFRDSNFVAHSLAQWAHSWDRFWDSPFSVVSAFVEGGNAELIESHPLLFWFCLFGVGCAVFLSLLMQFLIQHTKKKKKLHDSS